MKVIDEKNLVKKFYSLQNSFDKDKNVLPRDIREIRDIVKLYGKKILSTGKFNVNRPDIDDIAAQYASTILMKVKLGTFPRININFPILVYLYKVMYSSIDEFYVDGKFNKTAISTNELDYIDNLLYSQNRYSKPVGLQEANNNQVASKVVKWLRVFYNEHDVRRLFPLSYDYINQFRCGKSGDVPVEVADFSGVLISAVTRVKEDYGSFVIDLEKSNLLNTYSMLKILSSDVIDNKLLLAADLGAIYRLSVLQESGYDIKIPRLKDLNNAMSSNKETLGEVLEKFSVSKASNITEKIEKKPFLYKLLLTPEVISSTIRDESVTEKYNEFVESLERYYDEQDS